MAQKKTMRATEEVRRRCGMGFGWVNGMGVVGMERLFSVLRCSVLVEEVGEKA